MRIASVDDLANDLIRFAEAVGPLAGYRADMTDHPTAGPSLRHYLLLTECPEVAMLLGLSADERFWSRYYWLARFAREWQAVAGYDAGLEQQVFQLLESADHNGASYDPVEEVHAAVERDAVVPQDST